MCGKINLLDFLYLSPSTSGQELINHPAFVGVKDYNLRELEAKLVQIITSITKEQGYCY